MMIRVCVMCPEGKNIMGESEPLADTSRTHGYCRLHELEQYEREQMITPDEIRELSQLRLIERVRKRSAIDTFGPEPEE